MKQEAISLLVCYNNNAGIKKYLTNHKITGAIRTIKKGVLS